MELISRSLAHRLRAIGGKISDHNLSMLSSSISYYSALALAPFLLILLGVASIIGESTQADIIRKVSETSSPEVAKLIALVFKNVNQGVSIGSLSGVIGGLVLLSTASMVFLQFRYSFDVIYGTHDASLKKSTWATVRERLFAMVFVVLAAVTFIASLFGTTVFLRVFGGGNELWSASVVFFANFMVYLLMFTGIHYFIPSRRPSLLDALKIAAVTDVFFIVGNFLLAAYLRKVAAGSVYGAAGSLLVFLVWAYYSSFIVFVSAEVFLYFKRIGKIR